MKNYNNLRYDDDFKTCVGYANDVKPEDIKDLIFHNDTESIITYDFACKEIENVIINSNCKLPKKCLYNNVNLEKIAVNSEIIPERCFGRCSGKIIDGLSIILSGTKKIEPYAFSESFVGTVNLPLTLERIEPHGFSNNIFVLNRTLFLPDNLKIIGPNAFEFTNLTDIYLPDSLEEIWNLPSCLDIKLHMSNYLFKKLGLEKSSNIEITNEVTDLNTMTEGLTYKQINEMNLEKERINNNWFKD